MQFLKKSIVSKNCHDLCELATYFTNITGVKSLTSHLSFTWLWA